MSRESVRSAFDHSVMEPTLRVLAWAGVIVAAAVSTALAFGVLFGT